MDYNARFYDPAIAKFIQPDSIIPEPGSAIGFNRYAYVFNNPLLLIDPTGNFPDTPTCFGIDGYGNECGDTPFVDGVWNQDELWMSYIVQDHYFLREPDQTTWVENFINNSLPAGIKTYNTTIGDYSIETIMDWGKVPKDDFWLDVNGIAADITAIGNIEAIPVEVINFIDDADKVISNVYNSLQVMFRGGTSPNGTPWIQVGPDELDYINITLDALSLIPEVGMAPSLIGVGYNLWLGVIDIKINGESIFK